MRFKEGEGEQVCVFVHVKEKSIPPAAFLTRQMCTRSVRGEAVEEEELFIILEAFKNVFCFQKQKFSE